MRNCGRKHLKEVVLQFELFVFNDVSDAAGHDHFVRPVLKQYLLLLERYYFIKLRIIFFLIIGS